MNDFTVGYLLINVRYANGAVPVTEGKVVITRGEKEIGTYNLGDDGKTEIITLGVGDYSARVSANGFFDGEYDNITVVQNIISLQNVNLFPKQREMTE